MLARLWAPFALLALACGGADNQTVFDQHVPETGAGGSVAGQQQGGTGTGSGSGGAVSAGQASGGAAAGQGGAVMAGAGLGGGTGSRANTGGAPEGGNAQAGASGAATGGKPMGGSGGMVQAGAGGDPLEPKPAPGCPGYVDVYVPEQTCLWVHGSKFTIQTAACDGINPPERSCSVHTALPRDSTGAYGPLTVRLSSGAEYDRIDIPPKTSVCPKQCN